MIDNLITLNLKKSGEWDKVDVINSGSHIVIKNEELKLILDLALAEELTEKLVKIFEE